MKMHELKTKDFIVDEIESIELIGDLDTIDITVDDTHMFYANDVYSHNSGTTKSVIQNDDIAESFNKVFVSDIIVTFSRKLEDKVDDKGNLHISKNRHGRDGVTFEAETKLMIGQILIKDENSGLLKQHIRQQSSQNAAGFLKKNFSDFRSKKDSEFNKKVSGLG